MEGRSLDLLNQTMESYSLENKRVQSNNAFFLFSKFLIMAKMRNHTEFSELSQSQTQTVISMGVESVFNWYSEGNCCHETDKNT